MKVFYNYTYIFCGRVKIKFEINFNYLEVVMRNSIVISIVVVGLIIIGGCAGGWKTIKTHENPDFLYGTGNAESQNLQLAFDKATLTARTEIGRQLELKLNSLQKNFAEEVGAGDDTELNQLYSSATKAVVSVVLNGSKIKDQKYREKKGKYQAEVLVEYSLIAAKAGLLDKVKKEKNLYTRFRASEGFKEMEKEVEKYENWKKENK